MSGTPSFPPSYDFTKCDTFTSQRKLGTLTFLLTDCWTTTNSPVIRLRGESITLLNNIILWTFH